jgi:uncharacterized metal-binding protein YceD (DUF177 family)
MHTGDPAEFSRPLSLDRISSTQHREEIAATDKERADLADRFGLLSLDKLSASFTLKRVRKDLVRVKGHVTAELAQACVVTLEPVPARIDERFEVDFLEGVRPAETDVELDAEAAEAPEPAPDGWIDLGELAAEQLGLALDPYPRKPGAEVPAEWKAEAAEEPAPTEGVNPFSVLEKLKPSKP